MTRPRPHKPARKAVSKGKQPGLPAPPRTAGRDERPDHRQQDNRPQDNRPHDYREQDRNGGPARGSDSHHDIDMDDNDNDFDDDYDSDTELENDDVWPDRVVETRDDKIARRKELGPALAANETRQKASNVLEDIKDESRSIYRTLGPFISISDILEDGITYHNARLDWTSYQRRFEDVTQEEVDAVCKRFEELLNAVPSVARDIRWYAKKPKVVADLVKFMADHASHGRTADTAKLRYHVLSWAPDMEGYARLPPDTPKSLRGWKSPTTGRLICPADLIEDFDSGPEEFCEEVRDGKQIIHGGSFPLFCYDESKMIPGNPEAGLFQGMALISNCRGLSTGNRNAKKKTGGPSTRGKKGIALKGKTKKMTKVTEHTIAYTVVQSRFAFSTQEKWTPEDGTVSLPLLYDEVISAIDNATPEWRDRLFAYWNTWVFGYSNGAPDVANAATCIPKGVKSGADKLRQWRKERLEAMRSESREPTPDRPSSVPQEPTSPPQAQAHNHDARTPLRQDPDNYSGAMPSPSEIPTPHHDAGMPTPQEYHHDAPHQGQEHRRDASSGARQTDRNALSHSQKTYRDAPYNLDAGPHSQQRRHDATYPAHYHNESSTNSQQKPTQQSQPQPRSNYTQDRSQPRLQGSQAASGSTSRALAPAHVIVPSRPRPQPRPRLTTPHYNPYQSPPRRASSAPLDFPSDSPDGQLERLPEETENQYRARWALWNAQE